MKKLRLLCSVILTLIFIVTLSVSISADDKTKDDKVVSEIKELKIGDKLVRSQYCESTLVDKVIDIDPETKEIKRQNVWKAKITTLPQYLDDLETKIDPIWTEKGDAFICGANLFNATVSGTIVHVEKDGYIMEWNPSVMADYKQIKVNNPKPIIVNDLYNKNYVNNTLMWDYGICKRYIRVIEGLLQEIYIFDKSPDCNVTIYDNLKKDTGFKGKREAVAFDANGTSIDMGIMKSISKDQFNNPDIVYPITIDPDISYTTSASDGYLDQADGDFTSYSTCRTDSTSSDISYTGTVSYVGQYKSTGGDYNIYRSFLYFDTSDIGDGVTISSASLFLYFNNEGTGADFNIIVQTGTSSTYPHDPMTTSDFNYTLYTGSGGSLSTIDLPLEEYSEIELNATGYGWINKTGNTKFCLRSEEDINNSAPTNYERVRYTTYEYGTGYQPYLEVTYTIIEPSITAVDASFITLTSARINANVVSDGGEPCEVRFGYGTTSQTALNFESYDTVTSWVGGYETGDQPYLDISGLDPDTTYYFRVQIRNSAS